MKIAPSLVQASAKRNMPVFTGNPCRLRPFLGKVLLFDRHSEPPDQQRDLVQMLGILRGYHASKPLHALIVAHR
jgi:hypothetical protein